MESLPFLEDIFPPDLLYATTIRSPIAKGQLKSIQVPELPENYTFISAKDIPGENRLEGTNIPILADTTLSYIGEPAAILIGPDKETLEDLAARCEILFVEEKPIFDCNDQNIEPVLTRELVVGDTHAAFENSGKIVTGSYSTGIQEHWYAEPVGAVCWLINEQGGKGAKAKKANTVIVRTATQWPYHVKRSVIRALGIIEQTAVSVLPTALNMHMDGKLWYPSLIACHAALGTFITKKPVRLILSREEDFLFTPKRCNVNVDIASIIDDKGKINAAEIDISVNLGAYVVNGEEILDHICLGSLSFYGFENLKLTARAKKTNIPPQGPFCGFGLAQGLFAMERHISIISDITNQDPAIWRMERAAPALLLPSASSKNNLSSEELINSVAKASDYFRKWVSYELLRDSRKGKLPEKGENPRGIGIAVGFQGNGLLYYGEDNGAYSVEVTLNKESILEIKTSIVTSEDYNKIWERLAAEIMSIQPEMVRISSANAPDCGPSCASRNITAVTKLVEKCCLAIRKQRAHDPLPITVRRSVKPQSGSLRNGSWKVMDASPFSKPALAAAVVEITIDLVECIPVIRSVWLAVDGGKIISKNRAKRTLNRSATQALGWAFTENIDYINGALPRTQYDNFTIFSPVEIPPIHIDFISGGGTEPKGIGDLPFTCIPAAFLQAVSQAMDYSFKSIPLKRKDIWEKIRVRNIDHSTQAVK